MFIEIREKIKKYYKNTPLSYIDLIPRYFINELMALPIFDFWSTAKREAGTVNYLAIGASDVVATGDYPFGYAPTISKVLKASGSKKIIKNYQSSLFGSYARQIANKLRFNMGTSPSAKFDFATILVGYNDGLWNIPPSEFEVDLEELLRLALQCCDHVYMLDAKDIKKMPSITGLPKLVEMVYSDRPIAEYADEYHDIIHRVVDRMNDSRIKIVDIRNNWYYTGEEELTSDGLHPNVAGYNKIARIILKKIEENKDLMSRLGIDKIVI